MIRRLNIEIKPETLGNTEVKKLHIRIDCVGKPTVEKTQLCEPDELLSFFEQIWDCAKSEILRILKE